MPVEEIKAALDTLQEYVQPANEALDALAAVFGSDEGPLFNAVYALIGLAVDQCDEKLKIGADALGDWAMLHYFGAKPMAVQPHGMAERLVSNNAEFAEFIHEVNRPFDDEAFCAANCTKVAGHHPMCHHCYEAGGGEFPDGR